jgi:hypothetical protein
MSRDAELTHDSGNSIPSRYMTRLMLHWATIAVRHEALARRERWELERRRDITGGRIDPTKEMHAALIAISAVAHTLDALYGEIRNLALPPALRATWAKPRSGPPRQEKIVQALKHGFAIGKQAEHWAEELDWLDGLRDAAVHPKIEFREAKEHPVAGPTAPAYAEYSLESAGRAVDLMLDVFAMCGTAPKPGLEQWAEEVDKNIAPMLEAQRVSSRYYEGEL